MRTRGQSPSHTLRQPALVRLFKTPNVLNLASVQYASELGDEHMLCPSHEGKPVRIGSRSFLEEFNDQCNGFFTEHDVRSVGDIPALLLYPMDGVVPPDLSVLGLDVTWKPIPSTDIAKYMFCSSDPNFWFHVIAFTDTGPHLFTHAKMVARVEQYSQLITAQSKDNSLIVSLQDTSQPTQDELMWEEWEVSEEIPPDVLIEMQAVMAEFGLSGLYKVTCIFDHREGDDSPYFAVQVDEKDLGNSRDRSSFLNAKASIEQRLGKIDPRLVLITNAEMRQTDSRTDFGKDFGRGS